MFTLTVQQNDPGLDVGTVRGFFGYTIPYLSPTSTAGTTAPTNVLEDFNTDNPGNPGVNGIPIAAGFIFDQSNLQLNYIPGQLTAARLVREAGATTGANELQFSMQQNESFNFKVTYGPTDKSAIAHIRFKNPRG